MTDERSQVDFLSTLYAAPLRPELWRPAIQKLCTIMDINKAALIAHSPQNGMHQIFAYVGESIREGGPLYESHYCTQDEWTKRFRVRATFGKVMAGEQLWPVHEISRSVFYNEFLLHYDICQMAAMMTRGGGGNFETFSIYRGPKEEAFGPEKLTFLQQLLPHLEIALDTRRKLMELQESVGDLCAALDSISTAVVLLDCEAKVIFANKMARSILDKKHGVYLCDNHVECWSVKENSELRSLIQHAIECTEKKISNPARSVAISRTNGRQLHIIATPLPRRYLEVTRRAFAMLFLSDPDYRRTIPSEILRNAFRLTPAESRLALLLLAGHTLQSVGDLVGVGRETIRTQLKSLLSKTSTTRQSDLLRLLLNLGIVLRDKIP